MLHVLLSFIRHPTDLKTASLILYSFVNISYNSFTQGGGTEDGQEKDQNIDYKSRTTHDQDNSQRDVVIYEWLENIKKTI